MASDKETAKNTAALADVNRTLVRLEKTFGNLVLVLTDINTRLANKEGGPTVINVYTPKDVDPLQVIEGRTDGPHTG